METIHDIFISYSSLDKEVAEKVCSILEENGISCWMAPRNITPGVPFAEAIIDGIKSSKVFVLIYSSNSNISTQVTREVDRAVHHGLSLINFRIEDVPLSKQLEYYISSVHWLDAITPPLDQHIHQLCNVVKMFLKPEEYKDVEIAEALRKGIIKQNEPAGTGKRFGTARRRTILVSGILLAVVIIIVSLIVFNIGGIKEARAGSIESLVILPFNNYTGQDSLAWFVSGMHSSLIQDMGTVGGLRIIGETSSNAFKNVNLSITEIATKLNVDAVIEADVLCLGEDSVCFQTRLIKSGREEEQLWIADYKVARSQILNWYKGVTKQVAKEVKVNLTPGEEKLLSKTKEVDREAYDEYLRAYPYFHGNVESLKKARNYLNDAIEIYPEWAALYSALANVWYFLGGLGFESPDSAYKKAYDYTNEAIKLDPNLADAHRITAVMDWAIEWNLEKAEKEMLEALTLNPNHSLARMYYSIILFALQRPDEGIMQADFAYKLDPLNPSIQSMYGFTKLIGGDCETAMSVLENVIASDPDNFLAQNYIFNAAFTCGDLDKVFEADKHMLPLKEEAIYGIDKIYHDKGFNAAYTEITRQLEILADKVYIRPSDMACRYYMINQDNKAIDWIEKGAEVHEPGIMFSCSTNLFSRLYNNPRFIALMKKMNLPMPKNN